MCCRELEQAIEEASKAVMERDKLHEAPSAVCRPKQIADPADLPPDDDAALKHPPQSTSSSPAAIPSMLVWSYSPQLL